MAGHDLIAFTGAPAATSPFFLGESLEGARVGLRCDSPFVQLRGAVEGLGIAELACFVGDTAEGLVRVWPEAAPAGRAVWLVTHRDMRRSARVKAVSGAIVEAFQRRRKLLREGLRSTS